MINNIYNVTFWFLRMKRISLFSKSCIPVQCILVRDNFELCSNFNNNIYHSEFIVLINSSLLLNSKNFNCSFLFVSLQPCFFCCFFFFKYNIFHIYFFSMRSVFCYFSNILYFFLKRNVIFFYFLNINLSFLNSVLLSLFFLMKREF